MGADGEYVRAMSFSGSGFDSVMQLGVTHALLVIRGKAPDIVVGISAGAVQAAALAEILQEGDKNSLDALHESVASGALEDFDPYDYRAVLQARVRRFREVVESYYRAPEELFDTAIPNAYQIDARDFSDNN